MAFQSILTTNVGTLLALTLALIAAVRLRSASRSFRDTQSFTNAQVRLSNQDLAIKTGATVMTPVLRETLFNYTFAIVSVLFAILLAGVAEHLFGLASPLIYFLASVLVTSRCCGFLPGIVATALSFLTCWIFYLLPAGSQWVSSPHDAFQLAVFLLEGVSLSKIVGSSHSKPIRDESRLDDVNPKEKILWQGDEQFYHLVQGVKDYAIIMLDPNGYITSWNSGAERIYGYRDHQIIGKHFSIFYRSEDISTDRPSKLLQSAADGEPFMEEGIRLRRDGSEFYADVVIRAIRHGNGNLTGFSKVTRDVTERRRLDEELRRSYLHSSKAMEEQKTLERQLQQSQKMEAVGQLAGGISHDFNNLLTIISGYCEILLDELDPNSPLKEAARAISDAADRAASLTRQLLAFSRKSLLEPKILDLNMVVRETEKLLRRLIGEHISLVSVLDPNVGKVRVDPGQLGQVLMNLAVNARDAMPKGGALTIQTQNIDLDVEYTRLHPEARSGQYVLLSISDNGTGMSPEVTRRIFEPFYTTKEVGKGTGLGLAVVLGIVKQSGGHIEVYSEPEFGTSFKIYLPRLVEHVDQSRDSDSEDDRRGNEAILFVEDEERVRTLASLVLKAYGYEVLTASNGKEAMDLLESHPREIDLLVTDVVMPGMGGPDLAIAMKPLYPETKVLYCSGYTDDAVVRHGLLRREASFLQKPYTPTTLARKVRQVLDMT